MAKAKIQYKVQTVKDPSVEGGTLLRPFVVNQKQVDLDGFVETALEMGYLSGKFEATKGMVNSVFEAVKSVVLSGINVKIGGWVSFYGVLTGSVPSDTRAISSVNRYLARARICSDLSVSSDDFSFEQVDKPECVVKITSIASDGYNSPIVKKSVAFNIYGNYLQYVAGYGDKVTVEYDGLETPIQLVPAKSDKQHQNFAWPEALDDVPDGTPLYFKFIGHAGIEGGVAQTATFTAMFKE